MQFRIFDLLAGTALVAMCIAGVSSAVARLDPGELQREGLGLAATYIFFFVVVELSIRFARRSNKSEELSIPSRIGWRILFVVGVLLFVTSLAANFVLDGAFFVLSVPFVTLVLVVFLHRNVYANPNGVLVLFIPWLWENIEIVSGNDDTMQLRFKPTWLRLSADVPHEDQERVLDLASAPRSDGNL